MPCAVCEDNRLRVGSFLEEVRYNPVLGKKLALKDTIIEDNGKRYRFSMAVDLSAWEQQNNGYEDNEAEDCSLSTLTPIRPSHRACNKLNNNRNAVIKNRLPSPTS